MKRGIVTSLAAKSLAALWVLIFPAIASACPVCATREEGGSLRWVALGAFVLSPWIVSAFVALWIRNNVLNAPHRGTKNLLPPSESE